MVEMLFDIISLFPEMFAGPFGSSMTKRALEAELFSVRVTNPRDFALDKHHITDDYPFGGGSGMVMKPEPIFSAVRHVSGNDAAECKSRVILLCPQGNLFSQDKARELATYDHLIFICGHYEGVDERVRTHLVQESLSIGDYVLTGGELPAMVIVDAISRMIPGVLGADDGAEQDSFYHGLLEYPQYTRPREFEELSVPEVLLSGDHAKIERWRRKESLKRTLLHRSDLLHQFEFSKTDRQLIIEIRREMGDSEHG